MSTVRQPPRDDQRRPAIRAVEPFEARADSELDRLGALASRLLGAAFAAVASLDGGELKLRANGFEADPLVHSLCTRVARAQSVLSIPDLRTGTVKQAPLPETAFVSFLGVPLVDEDGHPLGALCIGDREVRVWREEEIGLLEEVATAVITRLELSAALRTIDRQAAQGRQHHADKLELLDGVSDAYLVLDSQGLIVFANQEAGRLLATDPHAIVGESGPQLLSERFGKSLAQRFEEIPSARLPFELDAFAPPRKHVHVRAFAGRDGIYVQLSDLSEHGASEQRLGAQYAVARVLGTCSTLTEAAPRVLEAVSRSLGSEFGAIWAVDPVADVLRCIEHWHMGSDEAAELALATQSAELKRGEGLPGRAWQSGEAVWSLTTPAGDEPEDGRTVSGGFAFPFRVDGGVYGVIELFWRDAPEPEHALVDLMASVTGHLGQFVERTRTEEALRESEGRLRVLVEQIPAILWTTDAELRPISAVGAGLAALNLPVEPVRGISLLQNLGADDGDMPSVSAHKQALAGKPTSYEIQWVGRTFDCHVEPMRDPDGAIAGVVGVALDVTDRLRVEDELRGAERRYRTLVEQLPLLTYVVPLDDGEVAAYTSPQLEAMLGYTPDEWTEELYRSKIHPDDRDRVIAERERQVESDEPVRLEYRIHARDGHVVWVLDERVLVHDDSGAPLYVQGYALDVSEQKLAEEALRTAEAKYRTLVEELPLVTYISAADALETIYISPQVETLLGYARELWLVGDSFFAEIIHPDDRERVLEESAEIRSSGRGIRSEFRLLGADGRVVWVHDEATVVADELGRPLFLQGFLLDITDRKQLEEQLRQAQKMEAVGQLAGGVAHDFNNLVTAITGYSDLLLMSLPNADPLRLDVEQIKKASDRAASLTRQLLAFSRRQVLQPRVVDLNEAVRDVEPMLRRLIGEHIELAVALASDLGCVRADPSQFETVVVNLAVNARDAMTGGGKLTIETANADLDETYAAEHVDVTPGQFVLLAVSDTGTGMDPDTRDRAFEPFFTTKEAGRGTGLGLATVYGIVKQSGGHVSVYSEPGRGASFKIYLPRVEAPAEGLTRRSVEAQQGGSETVVLVEDDEVVRALVREMLSRNGYSVIEAGTGADALLACRRHEGSVDLVITDVVMPGMSGRELAERLAEEHPGIKVLHTSGYTDEAIVQHGVLGPSAAFLQKPFSMHALAAKVREVLDA